MSHSCPLCRSGLPRQPGYRAGTYSLGTGAITLDDHGLVTGIVPGGAAPAGLAVLPAPWSPVARSASLTELTGGGNMTTGGRFQVLQPATIDGLRFRRSAGAGVVKGSVWNATATRVATKTSSVTGGTCTVLFDQPLVAVLNSAYTIGQWDTAGAAGWYTEALDGPASLASMLIITPPLLWLSQALYSVGDAMPDTVSPDVGVGAILAVEPIITLL